ncbi:MAG TPA: response regulator transcription factor [Steroidobacteraceae bacterium]|nr:response regulator transcription factor [Steroidobacteraceae bacterium]
MGASRILIVDDEPQIRRFLRVSLTAHGFEISEAANAKEALQSVSSDPPALIVLDLGLPDRDGQALLPDLRAICPAPVIVLSVRADEREKVRALDAGAADYIVKPFGMPEFLARVRAALRVRSPPEAAPIYTVGDLHIDIARHRVTLDGRSIRLSRREFDLLAVLAAHAGRVVTHTQLLREIWGPVHEQDTQYLRVYVRQLRDKLGDDPLRPRFIENEPGVGYRLLEPEAYPQAPTE